MLPLPSPYSAVTGMASFGPQSIYLTITQQADMRTRTDGYKSVSQACSHSGRGHRRLQRVDGRGRGAHRARPQGPSGGRAADDRRVCRTHHRYRGRRHHGRVPQRGERGRMRGRDSDHDGGTQCRNRAGAPHAVPYRHQYRRRHLRRGPHLSATASTSRRGSRASRRPAASAFPSKVYDEITRQGSVFACQDLGEQQLKNIAQPGAGLSVSASTALLRPTAPPPALPDKPSIAVLPFANMSGDPEQEYFATA